MQRKNFVVLLALLTMVLLPEICECAPTQSAVYEDVYGSSGSSSGFGIKGVLGCIVLVALAVNIFVNGHTTGFMKGLWFMARLTCGIGIIILLIVPLLKSFLGSILAYGIGIVLAWKYIDIMGKDEKNNK